MNFKKVLLFVVMILSFGLFGNLFIEEIADERINKSNYSDKLRFHLPYKGIILLPATMLLIFILCVLGIGLFWILSSVFGFWFIYLSFGIMLVTLIIIPITIYLVIEDIIYNHIESFDRLNTPRTRHDKYFYKMFK